MRSDADEPPEHDAAGALYESGESWVRFSDGVAPVPTIVRVAGEPGVGFRVEGAGSERLNGDYVRDPAGFPHEFKFRKAGGGSEYCYLSGGAWFLMADGVGSSWRASTTTLPLSQYLVYIAQPCANPGRPGPDNEASGSCDTQTKPVQTKV